MAHNIKTIVGMISPIIKGMSASEKAELKRKLDDLLGDRQTWQNTIASVSMKGGNNYMNYAPRQGSGIKPYISILVEGIESGIQVSVQASFDSGMQGIVRFQNLARECNVNASDGTTSFVTDSDATKVVERIQDMFEADYNLNLSVKNVSIGE